MLLNQFDFFLFFFSKKKWSSHFTWLMHVYQLVNIQIMIRYFSETFCHAYTFWHSCISHSLFVHIISNVIPTAPFGFLGLGICRTVCAVRNWVKAFLRFRRKPKGAPKDDERGPASAAFASSGLSNTYWILITRVMHANAL